MSEAAMNLPIIDEEGLSLAPVEGVSGRVRFAGEEPGLRVLMSSISLPREPKCSTAS